MTLTVKQYRKKYNLTMKQLRQRVAKDILQWLNLKKIKAGSGIFVELASLNYEFGETCFEHINRINNTDAKTAIKDIKQCSVCAIGAITLCMIDRFNSLNLGDVRDQHNHESSYLNQIFTKRQLEWIESFFECANYTPDTKPHLYNYWDTFGLLKPEERMRRIFKHVAKYGDFITKVFMKENSITNINKFIGE